MTTMTIGDQQRAKIFDYVEERPGEWFPLGEIVEVTNFATKIHPQVLNDIWGHADIEVMYGNNRPDDVLPEYKAVGMPLLLCWFGDGKRSQTRGHSGPSSKDPSYTRTRNMPKKPSAAVEHRPVGVPAPLVAVAKGRELVRQAHTVNGSNGDNARQPLFSNVDIYPGSRLELNMDDLTAHLQKVDRLAESMEEFVAFVQSQQETE